MDRKPKIKVPAWLQDVPSGQTNDDQKPPNVLKTVQDNSLNAASLKPPKTEKSHPSTTATGQSFRPSNALSTSAAPGRDTNFNLYDGENIGLMSTGGKSDGGGVGGRTNRKLTKKEQRHLKKQQQRAMMAAAGDPNYLSNANGDPTQENDINRSTIDDDKAEDQMGVAETYADYMPAKLKFGAPHPDPVVETSTLSSIEPNDITYDLSIPKRVISKGLVSALQLESIVYASQAHEKMLPDGTRAGFLIGDGAGVGKGRTVAGVIFENFQKGRKKAIWISVSNDLKYDAERDLSDIGAIAIDVHPLNKLKYGAIDSSKNGRIREGVIFSTYSSLISATSVRGIGPKYNSRLKQLVEWCGQDFEGVIIFDECHKAKNLVASGKEKQTKTGLAVLELQLALPLARVVYASATGASEPRNMAYMVRLGLWGSGTPFRNFPAFLQTVERRGVGAMEIVAMDMKLRGMYIARQLSFKGVTFQVEEVPMTDEFKQAYNDSVKLWVEAREKFDEASELIGDNAKLRRSMWGQFWGAHQRYFKYLCIASKVSHAVKVAKEAVAAGKCAVIGLQSTGEARTVEAMDDAGGELEDFISTAKAVFENLIQKQFPAPHRRFVGGEERKRKKSQKPKPSSRKRSRSSSLESIDGKSRSLRERKKVPRLVYSDDSDESETEQKMNVDSDADDSDDDDVKAKKKSSGQSSTESDRSDSDSGSDQSSEYSSSSESESSFIDDGSDDSDDGMGRSSRRRRTNRNRPASKTGNKTMQHKVWEIVRDQMDGARSSSSKQAQSQYNNSTMAMCRRACDMRDDLLDKIDELGDRLPSNTLDQLIDELGGSDEVAEMTGRKGRVVKIRDGHVQYESRCQGQSSLETMNIYEKDQFMNGDKLIAIISEAASNGISLQSDRRVKNQRRRVHITLELPWSADRAIQQFGRTHRSNQMNAPEYVFLISDLAGERRFASSVSKRLESLGALTHGDRRASESRNLAQFNVENKYGREALTTVCEKIFTIDYIDRTGDETDEEMKHHDKLVQVNRALKGVDIEGPASDIKIPKFLNRILGLPVDLQNYLFDYFMEVLDAAVDKAKRDGKYDLGIMDLGNTENAEKVRSIRFMRVHVTGVAPITVTTVVLERGMSWEDAKAKSAKITHTREGFYRSKFARHTGKRSVFLAMLNEPEKSAPILDSGLLKMYGIPFKTHRPNIGTQVRLEKLEEVIRKGDKIGEDEAEKLWKCHYDSSTRQCYHMFFSGRCHNSIAGIDCDEGMRRRRYTVLSGSLFAYWAEIEHFVRRESNTQIRVIRLKLTDGSKIVGVLLPERVIEDVIHNLRETSEEVKDEIKVTPKKEVKVEIKTEVKDEVKVKEEIFDD